MNGLKRLKLVRNKLCHFYLECSLMPPISLPASSIVWEVKKFD